MTYKLDKLTLISGIDIPVPELKVNIHQPTIREIAYIGEQNFFTNANLVTMDKETFLKINGETLSEEDKISLSQMSNFQLVMTMTSQDPLAKVGVLTLLTLLFPEYLIEFEERFIMLTCSKNKGMAIIDEKNFDILQQIIAAILCLNSGNMKGDFNPIGERAKAIAEKIQRGRAKVAALSGDDKKQTSILSRYISSLGIGTKSLSIHTILDLTLYQFFDQLERFSLKESYDMSIQARMAGAKDVEDIDWLKDIEK